MQLEFIAYLEEAFRRAPPARKGLRTRERLKIEAAKKLATDGYHSLRLADVTEAAGLGEGTIYSHFKDRDTVISSVISVFLDEFIAAHLEGPPGVATPRGDLVHFSNTRAAMRHWFSVCQANRGMLRCMMQMADDQPAFASQIQRFNARWTRRYANDSLPAPDVDPGVLLLLSYIVKFMVNELVRKLFIFPDDIFLKGLEPLGGDANLVADAAAVIWTRTLTPQAPLPRDLPGRVGEIIELLHAGVEAEAGPVPKVGRRGPRPVRVAAG